MNEDTLIIHRGECLKAQIDYTNDDGTVIDLSSFDLTCEAASHPVILEEVVLTYLDASKGTADIYIPSDTMDLLPYGRASWLRLAIAPTVGDGCKTISAKLWIDIQ